MSASQTQQAAERLHKNLAAQLRARIPKRGEVQHATGPVVACLTELLECKHGAAKASLRRYMSAEVFPRPDALAALALALSCEPWELLAPLAAVDGHAPPVA